MEPPKRGRLGTIGWQVAGLALAAIGFLPWIWSAGAIWCWPGPGVVVRVHSVLAYLAATLVMALRLGPGRRWIAFPVAGLLVVLAWQWVRPSNDRRWIEPNARAPVADFSGSLVTIRNLRAFTWRAADDYDVRWVDRTVDLDRLQTVDFLVSPFALGGAVAHTFLSFGFADGDYLAVSVEVRKEEGEDYDPVRGLFRHYETIFIIGEETDLIGLRTEAYREPVILYPIRVGPAEVRALFTSILTDATRLAADPEFYNSALNTCHLRILRHVNELREKKIGLDWRNYLPGWSDELAMELGLIDTDAPLEVARRRFTINERSGMIDDPRAWSRQIREIPGTDGS